MQKIIILFITVFTLLLCQTYSSWAAFDARVTIHQNTLNSFLKAIGTISNKGKTNVLGMDIGYTWFVKNPRINIDEDKSLFISDVSVDIGIFKYDTQARGDVLVGYDEIKNRIKINIKKVTFELYINLFGNKIHISDIDISGFYHPSVEFAGPEPLQSSFSVNLPDGTEKKIFVRNEKNTIHLEKEQIVVDSNLIFADLPFETTKNVTTTNSDGNTK